ncbi:MAG: hypothetical protein ACW98X_25220 [Promethearchaeota archaeon]|jgi:hypothetical protein
MSNNRFSQTNKQNLNIPIWLQESYVWHSYSSLYTQPFNPFAILSTDTEEILYFTQTLAQTCGVHPSSRKLSKKKLLLLNPKLYSITSGSHSYTIISSPDPIALSMVTGTCVEDLTHELRTGSLLMDLSHYLMKNVDKLESDVIGRFTRAAARQKILSIISSDFIELLLGNHLLHPVSLHEILKSSLKYLQTSPKTQINIVSSSDSDIFEQSSAEIWGSSHTPLNILSTVLAWLYGMFFTIEIEVINSFSIGISFNLPDNFLLTNHQGFPLIEHYLRFLTSYFNYNYWITQNTITIIFPRVIRTI